MIILKCNNSRYEYRIFRRHLPMVHSIGDILGNCIHEIVAIKVEYFVKLWDIELNTSVGQEFIVFNLIDLCGPKPLDAKP